MRYWKRGQTSVWRKRCSRPEDRSRAGRATGICV